MGYVMGGHVRSAVEPMPERCTLALFCMNSWPRHVRDQHALITPNPTRARPSIRNAALPPESVRSHVRRHCDGPLPTSTVDRRPSTFSLPVYLAVVPHSPSPSLSRLTLPRAPPSHKLPSQADHYPHLPSTHTWLPPFRAIFLPLYGIALGTFDP